MAIGDKELVSSARTDIRNSLRNDVRRADSERDEAKAQLAAERQFGEKVYPILTAARLQDRRIGLVMLGETTISADTVRDWLDPSKASLSLVAQLREDVDPEALAGRAGGTRYADVAQDPTCSTTSAAAPASRWSSAATSCAACGRPCCSRPAASSAPWTA